MEFGYYFKVFLRRLPYFLVVSILISTISVIVAKTLPPSYVSSVKLIIESPQIPIELASPTVRSSGQEQLQIVEQKLLTRENLIDIANRVKPLKNQEEMSADQVVQAMLSRTNLSSSTGRNKAALMTIKFEAVTGLNAANVLNEYLTLIQKQDIETRRGRASQTLEFFQQEVDRLSEELTEKSAKILAFKLENSDALPESLDFRLTRQTLLQERIAQLTSGIEDLQRQRGRLTRIFESTGKVAGSTRATTPEQARLNAMRAQLAQELAIYSADNPKIKALEARIRSVEKLISQIPEVTEEVETTGNTQLDIQLVEIDTRLKTLTEQREAAQEQLNIIAGTVTDTPATSIMLDDLILDHENIQAQYNKAVERVASASAAERIELLSRGQKISVIEPPSIPSRPTKPKRAVIAGGGIVFGILSGLFLVVLLELLNSSIQRPEDLVNKLGITPLATVPYIRTGSQKFVKRTLKIGWFLCILIGLPALIFAIHTYYQPLDLVAERLMDKFGIR